MRAKIVIILATYVYFILTLSRKYQQKLQNQVQEYSKTILLANRFYSEEFTAKIYNITDLYTNKPLVFVLQSQQSLLDGKILAINPVSIKLQTEQTTQICQFNSYFQICYLLPEIVKFDFKITATCQKLPCDINWVIVQTYTPTDNQKILQSVLSFQQNTRRAIVTINCNNPELRPIFANDIHLYSNSPFKKQITANGSIIFLFNNPKQRLYYITTDNDKYRLCAQLNIYEVKEDIQLINNTVALKDFFLLGEQNKYKFKNLPRSSFHIQFYINHIIRETSKSNTTLKLKLIGYKQSVLTTIKSLSIDINNQKDSFVFSSVFDQILQYDYKVQLFISVANHTIVAQIKLVFEDVHQIALGQQSFFSLIKGRVIKYNIEPIANQIKNVKQIYILTNDPNLFKTSLNVCGRQGCQFSLQALETAAGNLYIGTNDVKNTSEITIVEFSQSVSAKLREGQYLYCSKKLQPKNTYQLIVNSPSVLVYTASKSKCGLVDERLCYQKAFNSHHSSVYESNNQDFLLFKVISLKNCEFTLTVLNKHSRYLFLNDSIPFTYALSENQKQVVFLFKLQKIMEVSFNLIAPLHQLNLLVINKQQTKIEDQSTALISSDGFISFLKEDIQSLQFVVKVAKRQEYLSKHIHFTLIASTTQANLRLQPGIAHYETLKPQSIRQYVFEFQLKKTILLNFYTHNIKQSVNINLIISTADYYSDKDKIVDLIIDREVDVLDIGFISKRLCMQQQDENCQLFLRLQNLMQIQVDITLTLIMENAIIELKDGIWQNYGVNAASTKSHFYFWPKNPNQSIIIFYKSSLIDIHMLYRLWKCDHESIDISQWPFPLLSSEKNPRQNIIFKNTNLIRIQSSAMKSCWPYCVVLISIKSDMQSFKSSLRALLKQDSKTTVLPDQQFKMMASNNYIQIPQKHRVDIAMTRHEQKKLLVNLKYLMSKQILIFDRSVSTGNILLRANVYSEKNAECPNSDGTADFDLLDNPTQILIQDVRQTLLSKRMQKDQNLYLCILAKAEYSSKFSIELSSQIDHVRILPREGSFKIKSEANQITFYQVDMSQQFQLKINKIQGELYLWTRKCIMGKHFETCIQQFRISSEKGHPIMNKINRFDFQGCQKCRLLIKITSISVSSIIIYTLSKQAYVQLLEGNLMSDNLDISQQNKYLLIAFKSVQINIHVNVISGDVQVIVRDFDSIDIIKTSSSDYRNIHIVIPPRMHPQNIRGSTNLTTLQHVHISIQSRNGRQRAVYSITYTTADSTIVLQGGLITEYTLVPNNKISFLYENSIDRPIYLHLSTIDPQTIKSLTITISTSNSSNKDNQKIPIVPSTPDFHKKTPNPTMLIQLPAHKMYFIDIYNNYDRNFGLSIAVNNRQSIFLPFDHDFPVQLDAAQQIFIVLSPTQLGYVKLRLSKCDISQPIISYTFDYKQMMDNDFLFQEEMSDQLIEEIVIKVVTVGSLYLKIKSADNDSSLMNIKASFSQQKFEIKHHRAGDNGVILYQLLDSTKAELTITSLVCSNLDKQCAKDFLYSAVSSDKIQNVYAQLVCPSIMFDLQNFQQIKSADFIPIPSSSVANNKKMTFTHTLAGDIDYVGVKAYNQKNGEVVYYRPVQIVTFWGHMSRSSGGEIVVFVMVACILLVIGYLMNYTSRQDQYKSISLQE